MLYVPAAPSAFNWQLSSQAGVRPADAFGTSVTPGNNTKGSWSSAIISAASLVNDVVLIHIYVNSNFVAAATRDTLLDIGIDPAGGTAFTVKIPDLLVSNAGAFTAPSTGGGVNYIFPLFIPAGSSIAARASVNNATVGTLRVWLRVYGLPRFPDLIRAGQSVVAYGVVAASSRGTLVTPGTTSEGAWTSLGTTSLPHFWWQIGMGINDATQQLQVYFADLAFGDATNKILLIEDEIFVGTTSEAIGVARNGFGEYGRLVQSGSELFVRAQSSGTPDSNVSLAAYGVVP